MDAPKAMLATLPKGQEIESINMKVSDDGEIIVSWDIYKPSKKNSESNWEPHTVVCGDCDEAKEKLWELYSLKLKQEFVKKNIPCG